MTIVDPKPQKQPPFSHRRDYTPDELRGYRTDFGETQTEFAARIGLSLRQYQALESGRAKVRRLHINAIAHVTEAYEWAK